LSAKKKTKETPLMKQYNQIKAKYPDALLLFRVGDFYETFGQDAVKAARILGILLTKRGAGSTSETELAGFPHHSLHTYLPKLVRAGQRVAICDQLEDPKLTKKIVKRGVTELVTPGVTLTDGVLEAKSNNFLGALYTQNDSLGFAYLDISTGEFQWAQGALSEISALLQQLEVKELLVSKPQRKAIAALMGDSLPFFVLEDWVFQTEYTAEKLMQHFGVKTLKGFGFDGADLGMIAAGVVLHYLSETEHAKLGHLVQLKHHNPKQQVWMDRFTVRNLELISPNAPEAITLLEVVDHTATAMGGRLLRRWITAPVTDVALIENRLDVVRFFKEHPGLHQQVLYCLKEVTDIERLAAKVATGRINPREVNALRLALMQTTTITGLLSDADPLAPLLATIDESQAITNHIGTWLTAEAPTQLGKGQTIATSVSAELDELRALAQGGRNTLDAMLERESARTGIPSLKIAFNNVFGYYIEVRNLHKDKVPEDWVRKQTLVNAERYITDELKTYETKILGAEERIAVLEQQLFQELIVYLTPHIQSFQNTARGIAQIDVLHGFTTLALKENYCHPEFVTHTSIEIVQGRHPVIEHQLPPESPYIPNDVYLDNDTQQIIMITGPNMSGKSAILRQTALIVLMAQMGSYVPALEVRLGVVDKLFTRVGASDNISKGESTFMVEMHETAAIMNNISARSLILLDEIGRGTSTYDGISIAWALAEFVHEHPTHPKTLFATHYHELNEMSSQFDRIKNFNVSVQETSEDVLFLRKLVPGGSAHSFGIHVAKMAGMPRWILERAKEMLQQLEASRQAAESGEDPLQLSMFQLDDPLLEDLRKQILDLNIDELTPVEALMQLNDLKRKLSK
jgi:DNA mismatch repair protein MutS